MRTAHVAERLRRRPRDLLSSRAGSDLPVAVQEGVQVRTNFEYSQLTRVYRHISRSCMRYIAVYRPVRKPSVDPRGCSFSPTWSSAHQRERDEACACTHAFAASRPRPISEGQTQDKEQAPLSHENNHPCCPPADFFFEREGLCCRGLVKRRGAAHAQSHRIGDLGRAFPLWRHVAICRGAQGATAEGRGNCG